MDLHNLNHILEHIKEQAAADNFVLTLHALDEMQDDSISLDDVLAAIAGGVLLENYPGFYKGPFCLIGGGGEGGRPLHIVCSTSRPQLFIITVYEPKSPKWVSPTERGQP